MHPRIRTLLALLLAIAAPAAAQPGIGTCVMGETRGSTGGLGGLYGQGITVYQWFDPAACGFCLVSNGAIQMRTLEIQVFNLVAVPSTIDAVVTFLGWKGSVDCPQPDESVATLPPPARPVRHPARGGTATLHAPRADPQQSAVPAAGVRPGRVRTHADDQQRPRGGPDRRVADLHELPAVRHPGVRRCRDGRPVLRVYGGLHLGDPAAGRLCGRHGNPVPDVGPAQGVLQVGEPPCAQPF